MSRDVLDDSLEARCAALEAAHEPSQRAILTLRLSHLLVDVCKDYLDRPDDRKQDGPEGHSSYMHPESPAEGSANWTVEFLSVWREIPDACDRREHELPDVIDERDVPEKGKQVEIPSVSKIRLVGSPLTQ